MSNPLHAVVIHKAGDLRIDEFPEPVPAPNEAVIDIVYGGICGSDLHYWQHGAAGESILRAPMVLGHEVVGIVRRAAPDGTGPAEGAHVAVHPATPAKEYVRHPADRPNISGGGYLGSAARFPHRDGAFAQRVAMPTRMLRVLPNQVDLKEAALIEPASVAWHAVNRIGDVAGQSALVVGCGPIGLLAIAVLKARGARHVTAVDLHDRPLAVAKELGADIVLKQPDDADVAAIDADVVIESSGSHRGLDTAIRGATRGGVVAMVGLLPSGPQPVQIALAIARELDLLGCFRFNDEIDEVIRALADGTLHVAPVISHVEPWRSAKKAFAVAADPTVSSKVLLRFRSVR
ncbi:L-idonate 5-dehydrogenase [Microbacterium capsulatum]|uniref:L-idonate 5-dehydrogenase n=1 Tax=Microbacterium capsulatum TaxID=3041921 RepID=A0ABU0XN34_9MICO|nr:L-idonate 5-dehydrogenase [Microbacterium sp. ASV81]MDQ4215150.1 L-idonate 5-dehydrogenase [Microbacterium sp. ASV81]